MRAAKQRSLNPDPHRHGSQRRPRWQVRRGAIVVFAAILMIMMMAMLAFSVDVGYMYTMESQLQRSVDAAALAGAGALVEGEEEANERVVEYLVRNPVGRNYVIDGDGAMSAEKSQFLSAHSDDLEVKLGHWDPNTRTFSESNDLPSTISVKMTYPNNPLFFARFLGNDEFTVSAESIAMYQPRDIMVVLDFSGSMNNDTEFTAISSLGREVVETNIAECWADLGSPTYGNMQFEPQYITVAGQPASGPVPHVTVEYRHKEVYITSTKDLSNVVLQYDDGSTQKFEGLSGQTGTFAGTGSHSGDPIYKVWVKSGPNSSGEGPGYGEPFDFHPSIVDDVVEEALGLDSVPYPYASGSWDSFIDWAQSGSSQNDDHGGYRWKFGYKNLLVYWLEKKPRHSQTADLWKVRAQPVHALKTSTEVFMGFIQEVDTDDRVGLAIYNGPGGDGYLESGLTNDFDHLVDLFMHRQAAHYHSYTNIGGGLRTAREELEANGRTGAFKMVVLMTDGVANWSDGGYDISDGRAFTLEEGQNIANHGWPVLTISLGAGADTDLMQQVADMHESGRHFNIPGGQTGDQYADALIEAFREIAKDRPLKIVK